MIDWADGSYELTAQAIAPASEALLDTLTVQPGERLLDVGCGTGNLALAAALRGARVTAVDPAAGLVERARQRDGADAVTWAVMEDDTLPVADGSFDVVASCFAVIFAADPVVAAAGLRRACAPGGRIGYTAWLPEGAIAEAGRILMGAVAPDRRPTPWDEPDVGRQLLGAPVSVTRHSLAFTAASPEAWLAEQEERHPVWRAAVRALPPTTLAQCREASIGVLAAHNASADAFRVDAPYVVVLADR